MDRRTRRDHRWIHLACLTEVRIALLATALRRRRPGGTRGPVRAHPAVRRLKIDEEHAAVSSRLRGYLERSWSRKTNFFTLPDGVRGSSGTSCSCPGHFCRARPASWSWAGTSAKSTEVDPSVR